MKVLVTCPPMLGLIDEFVPIFQAHQIKLTLPNIIQEMAEPELMELLPDHDGWIIGDDPANDLVLSAGARGKLKAAVRWGIGVDNVDIAACKRLGIAFSNTPNVFGDEVADMALGYLIASARETFLIDREIRKGDWPKPVGISLAEKKVAVVGYGDIGQRLVSRLSFLGMHTSVYDPFVDRNQKSQMDVNFLTWPEDIGSADFLVFTCALTETSYRMLNAAVLDSVKFGVRIINVSRGDVIDELDLINALQTGRVYSVAMDVFAHEPVPSDSLLLGHPRTLLGSHNSSNTQEAVRRASETAISMLFDFLGVSGGIS